MVVLRRENWGGKYRSVVRDDDGKIISWAKWNQDKNSVRSLGRVFKDTGTFSKDVKRFELKNVVEFSDFSSDSKIPRGVMKGQGVARTHINGQELTARSQQMTVPFSKRLAIDEALESLYERIAQAFGLEYDEDEGRMVATQENLKIETGVVYYRKRAV